MKEEIFLAEENNENPGQPDSEEKDVDIMALEEGAIGASAKEDEEIQDSVEHISQLQTKTNLESMDEIIVLDNNLPAIAIAEVNDTAVNSVTLTEPVNAVPSTTMEYQSRPQIGDDEDWESLISFSEAEDTTPDQDLDDQTHDMQMPVGQSIKSALEAMADDEEFSSRLNENVTPNYTVGINEIGQFVVPEINFFEDAINSSGLPLQNDWPRLSLDNTVIVSFPLEQALIPSPPKRQIPSVKQQDNVSLPSEITNSS